MTERMDLPSLVPATRSRLVVERGGYKVQAESPGESLVVLPIEYSRCLSAQFTTDGAVRPQLVRVNLAMTGLLFAGRVEADLKLRYGPLDSDCRLQDWRDAEAIRLGDARAWPAERPSAEGP